MYIHIYTYNQIKYRLYNSKCGHFPSWINLDPSDPCCGHWLQQLPHRIKWWQSVGAAILTLVYAMGHWEIHLKMMKHGDNGNIMGI